MIDTSLLHELFQDKLLVKNFLCVLQTEFPYQMNDMKTAFANNDYDKISIIAHSIKSQLSYLKEKDAQLLASEIENMENMENQKTKLDAKINELITIVNRITRDIELLYN